MVVGMPLDDWPPVQKVPVQGASVQGAPVQGAPVWHTGKYTDQGWLRMLDLLTAPENLAFTVALFVMVLIALLEGFAVMIGAGLNATLEAILPGTTMHLDTDVPAGNGLTRVLGWMRVGEVPALIVLITLLTSFGLCGLSMQSMLKSLFGAPIPGALAWAPALLGALPITRVFTGVLSRALPRDQTEAVSRDSFVGITAVITTGDARTGHAAQARFNDRFGNTHYALVEPVHENLAFEQGTTVVIIKRDGSRYLVDAPRKALPGSSA